MGSRFKQGMFDAQIQGFILDWAKPGRESSHSGLSAYMANESLEGVCVAEEPTADDNGVTASVIMELTHQNRLRTSFS